MLRVVRTGPHPTSTFRVLRLQARTIALSLCDDGNWARVLSKHSINLDTCLGSPEVLLHCYLSCLYGTNLSLSLSSDVWVLFWFLL